MVLGVLTSHPAINAYITIIPNANITTYLNLNLIASKWKIINSDCCEISPVV